MSIHIFIVTHCFIIQKPPFLEMYNFLYIYVYIIKNIYIYIHIYLHISFFFFYSVSELIKFRSYSFGFLSSDHISIILLIEHIMVINIC